ncbi:hypothetical protein C8A01DRAFT_40243 [Parachaetomium inaequale]|uniref:Uncharacterized protein n=1 Tax=Parachaetomium inaequale TaxID=2588326 RepID=A0AAN6SN66_9PEZI|nr:hypothetical protein C8A01DRAFT_40243 [Parachaetomium inaequale]
MFVDHPFSEQHRKRLREDEEDASSGSPVGFTEHRSKRLQSLPLRTSPNSRRWIVRPSFSLPNPTFATTAQGQAVTPQEPMQEHVWADEPELVSIATSGPDHDMDMMDMSEPASGCDQPGLQRQHNIQQDSFPVDQSEPSVTGRIPTPIHCSFAVQVRGNNWNGGSAMHGPGDILATTPEEPNAAAFSSNGLVDLSSHKFAAAAMADWSMVQNRRLPSPISECGAEESHGSSARMALDSSSLHGGHHHLSHLTHEHPLVAGLPPRASSAMEARSAREATPAAEHQYGGCAMDVESPATPSPKKGHTRSKHTVNSWTALQPGMTRSFSIGYRADCERCRNKVPGHFNHIIIS